MIDNIRRPRYAYAMNKTTNTIKSLLNQTKDTSDKISQLVDQISQFKDNLYDNYYQNSSNGPNFRGQLVNFT